MDNNLILRTLGKMGYPVASYQDYLPKIEAFKSWYAGKVNSFHRYTYYNGIETVSAIRKSMQMGKKVSEDWANLILNEKVEINISDEGLKKEIQEILKNNKFFSRANKLIEVAFALGTGAFVERAEVGEEKKIFIDYVRADLIFPLVWDDDEITECAFASQKIVDGKECVYLAIHCREGQIYHVKNKLYRSNASYLKEIPLPDGVPEDWDTKSELPLFQIVRPNIVNNLDLDAPFGISVFFNALDQIKGIDLVYDSYMNEFVLGKKRLIVPVSMAQKMASENGRKPVFDSNDTVFYALDAVDAQGKKDMLIDINPEIRAEAHSKALQDCLNLISDKVGFGTDRYKFDKGAVKTATEVISVKSDMYNNLIKHEQTVEEAIVNMVKAIAFLLHGQLPNETPEISVNFDDSIITDENTEIDNNIKLTNARLKPRIKAIMDLYEVDETEAQKMLDQITEEDKVEGDGDADFFGTTKSKGKEEEDE